MISLAHPSYGSQPNLFVAARDLLHRGICVVPIADDDKNALVKWIPYQKRMPDVGTLWEWFNRHSNARIGAIMGRVSGGLGSRDFDIPESYDEWRRQQPNLAAILPTSKTKRGYQVFFRCSGYHAAKVRAMLGSEGGNGAITMHNRHGEPDGELRFGSGCLCVLPPSPCIDGGFYRWINDLPANVNDVPKVSLIDAGMVAQLCCSQTLHRDTVHTGDSRDLGDSIRGTERLPIVLGAIVGSDCPDDLPSAVRDAIAATLPTAANTRHRLIFDFVRYLKSYPALRGVNPEKLIPLVRMWHDAALPRIATKAFDVTLGDFLDAWDKCRHAKGAEPIDEIMHSAKERGFPNCAERVHSVEAKALVALCGELQRRAGGKPFYLDCRTAGKQIGLSHTSAAAILKLMVRLKILSVDTMGEYKKGLASTYRYLGD